jgi:hypothetical protein
LRDSDAIANGIGDALGLRRAEFVWGTPSKPSIALDLKRDAVRAAASRFRAIDPRVFGSVLHSTDHDDSDLDLLATYCPALRFSI